MKTEEVLQALTHTAILFPVVPAWVIVDKLATGMTSN